MQKLPLLDRYGIDLIISGHRHYQKLLLPGETTKTARNTQGSGGVVETCRVTVETGLKPWAEAPAFPFATIISGGGGGITSDRAPARGDFWVIFEVCCQRHGTSHEASCIIPNFSSFS